MKHHIAMTRNGIAVSIDLISSPAAAVVGGQPRLLELAKKVLEQTSVDAPVVRIESHMGQHVGYNYVVRTADDDVILYARQLRETVYTRFVKNGKPATTKYLSLVLHRQDGVGYLLHEIWTGRMRPPRPGDGHETATSRVFWESHAYVMDPYTVQPRSTTKVRPY